MLWKLLVPESLERLSDDTNPSLQLDYGSCILMFEILILFFLDLRLFWSFLGSGGGTIKFLWESLVKIFNFEDILPRLSVRFLCDFGPVPVFGVPFGVDLDDYKGDAFGEFFLIEGVLFLGFNIIFLVDCLGGALIIYLLDPLYSILWFKFLVGS